LITVFDTSSALYADDHYYKLIAHYLENYSTLSLSRKPHCYYYIVVTIIIIVIIIIAIIIVIVTVVVVALL